MREWWSKLRCALQGRRSLDEELGEELRSHFALLREDKEALGLPPGDAELAARRQFGNETAAREQAREAWHFPRLETFLQDLRSGLRSVRKAPSFSLVIILTLALGIGANSAIFSVVYAVLLRRPPYPAGERLVELWESAAGQRLPITWINFQHWRAENHTFEDMAGFETGDLVLTGRGDALLAHAGVASAGFFRLTGWRPLRGRLFDESDDRPGAAPVALVTGEFWAKTLSGDARVLGTTLNLDGKAYQIIGIVPFGARFFTRPVDVYLPAGPRDGKTANRADHGSMVGLGLLKAGVRPALARADLDAIMHRLAVDDPGPENDHRSSIAWLADFGLENIRPTLFLLMGAVGLVLAIACANVASLLLARSTARAREIAIRAAIGAGRARIARQLLTENLVVCALGGGLGLALAGVCLRALVQAGPRDIPHLWDAGLNLPVLLFTAGLTLLTALFAGLAPVLNLRTVDLTLALKDGSPAAGAGRRGHSLRSDFVVSEIAVTLVLAFGCGLLLRSLLIAETENPGFDASGVLALEVQLPPSRYKSDEAVRQFYTRLIEDLRRKPGVISVGAVDCPPSTGGCARGWYSIADLPAPSSANVPLTLLTKADPDYFHTMGVHLIAGRPIREQDRAGSPDALVVNEKLASRWWPGRPQLAVGHPLKFGGPYMEGPTYPIVGVVSDVKQARLDAEASPEIYVPFAQSTSTAMVVMIRAAGDPNGLIPAVRRAMALVDREVPIQSLRPFEQWTGATLERRRFSTLLLAIFAALAVILSAVGVYGILNYWIGVRHKEIAIRSALGAQRSQILRWAGLQATRLVGLGAVLGMLGSWVASRWLKSMLFGVAARDPAILLGAVAAVLVIAALAASLPLWRATRVDAIRNLRDA